MSPVTFDCGHAGVVAFAGDASEALRAYLLAEQEAAPCPPCVVARPSMAHRWMRGRGWVRLS